MLLFAWADAPAETWTDPAGDVTQPNADLVCGGAFVDGETVHFLARFADVPFAGGTTHQVDWCLNLDADSSSGGTCNGTTGVDVGLHVELTNEGSLRIQIGGDIPDEELDPDRHSNWTGSSPLFHVWFPLSLLQDDGQLDYVVSSIFGGSFGANEKAPDSWDFDVPGMYFSSSFGPPQGCGFGEDPGVLIGMHIGDVIRLADEGVLGSGMAESLLTKLEDALDHLQEGRPRAARNLLFAFINEVGALVMSGHLSAADGDALIEKALQAAEGLALSSLAESRRMRPSRGERMIPARISRRR